MRRLAAPAVAIAVLLAGCGADGSAPAASPATPAAPTSQIPSGSVASPTGGPAVGTVQAAPGSSSEAYEPNPGAIVVAIDPGHGGCLDWGVADPSERGVELAEKTLTLAIAQRLRDRLEADGLAVIMIRDDDSALAGDHYPDLGCEGPPWRDVNGDGEAGFDPEGATRTRDELQARLDLANLARADALVSIHINSPFDAGEPIEIAFTETFYTDETPWGAETTARLASSVQAGVVDRLGAVADYDRGDRGITAHNFYLVAPTLFEPTADRPDPLKQPTRGALMPTVLSEVGSITLREEHDLLASDAGQQAVADGLFDGIAAFFAERQTAVRIEFADDAAPSSPEPVDGDGPPFWPPAIDEAPLRLRVTNTGTEAIPTGASLVAGWEPSDAPYLPAAPQELTTVGEPLPALGAGDSVEVAVSLPEPPGNARAVAWISLSIGEGTAADAGSPALQVATEVP